MIKIIFAIILLSIAILSFFMSIRSFMQKGFLFNNAYIYASKKERESMNLKPYYHQSAIVFLIIGNIFSLNAISILLNASWITYIVISLTISAVIYAIISSIIIEKNK